MCFVYLAGLPLRALPIFLDATLGEVIVVGPAERVLSKLEMLSARGAHVCWFPTNYSPERCQLTFHGVRTDSVQIELRPIEKSDLDSAIAIIDGRRSAADQNLWRWARELRVPINVIDRPEHSSFLFPAIVDRGDVVVAVGTGGASPVLARRLRERIEAILPAKIGVLCEFLGRQRARLAVKLGSGKLGREFWEAIIDGPIALHAMEGRSNEAESLLDKLVSQSPSKQGAVTLVGAGPGDPDLLTLKALHALQQADVIFYDALVTPSTLAIARREARKLFVGKRKGLPGISQAQINKLMIEAAAGGSQVVRLKNGDPFIFGRGGEEVAALEAAGIAVEVVPGITAALGCAAAAAIPLTFRGEATKLVILTGHQTNGRTEFDWTAASDPQATVVVYMARSSAEELRDGLVAAGRDPATPVAIVARGTRPDMCTRVGPLNSICHLSEQVGEGPAIVIVGDVVARSKWWQAANLDTVTDPKFAEVA